MPANYCRTRLLLLFLLLLILVPFCTAQRQRVDGGNNRGAGNGAGQYQQQQRYIPSQGSQQQQQYYQYQQPQQQQYYSYNYNGNGGGNNANYGQPVQFVPQQQLSSSSSYSSPSGGNYYYPQSSSSSQYGPSSGSSSYSSSSYGQSSAPAYAYGQQSVAVPSVSSQGAGGQYGGVAGGQGLQQPIPISSAAGGAQQQLTQFGGNSVGNAGGSVQQQLGQGVAQQSRTTAFFTTPAPLTLPPHPPTLATLMPSLFPTPPPQPIYDPQAAIAAAQEPYQWNFDFAPGTPVVYCSYGANPIPVYNTPKKRCIPYHPLCGITFTCIFDVDPQTGHVWGHSSGTKKK